MHQIPEQLIVCLDLERAIKLEGRLTGMGTKTACQLTVTIEGQDLLGKTRSISRFG
jgi:hypothetical protein